MPSLYQFIYCHEWNNLYDVAQVFIRHLPLIFPNTNLACIFKSRSHRCQSLRWVVLRYKWYIRELFVYRYLTGKLAYYIILNDSWNYQFFWFCQTAYDNLTHVCIAMPQNYYKWSTRKVNEERIKNSFKPNYPWLRYIMVSFNSWNINITSRREITHIWDTW